MIEPRLTPDYDLLTKQNHIAPEGMEHHERRLKGKGNWIAAIKMPHWIIVEHQKAFPDLAKQMKNNPDATNLYGAFLAIVPLQIKGQLTEELRKDILKSFKLL